MPASNFRLAVINGLREARVVFTASHEAEARIFCSVLSALCNAVRRYYQWVPFVFMLLALLSYFPAMVWRLLGWRSGTLVVLQLSSL